MKDESRGNYENEFNSYSFKKRGGWEGYFFFQIVKFKIEANSPLEIPQLLQKQTIGCH